MQLADAAADEAAAAAKIAALERQLSAAQDEVSAALGAVEQLQAAQVCIAEMQADLECAADVARQLAEAREEILLLEAQLAAGPKDSDKENLGGAPAGAPGQAAGSSGADDGGGLREQDSDGASLDAALRQQVLPAAHAPSL